jgi:hypothetical protein
LAREKCTRSEITLENPGAEALGGAVLGVNFDKHWGLELAGERDLNIDAFIYTFGLRIFYPEH